MKKIYVINGRFLTRSITGVERYAREITAELDKLLPDVNLDVKIAVPHDTKNIPTYKNIKVVEVGRLHGIPWEQISLPIFAEKVHAITINLCNSSPLVSPGIVCIHDMKVMARPEFFSRKFRIWYRLILGNAARRAKQIITVSDFSKKEIIRYLKKSSDSITVIPDAWQHMNRICCDESALTKYGLKKGEYNYTLGSMEPNKNLKWIIEEAKKNPKQIFAVAGSLNNRIFSKEGFGNLPNNIKLLGYVTDEESKTLMRDCKIFLFPSFYEGFGLPPLEAMASGAKTIAVSDIPVMHEIFEDTVEYLNIVDKVKNKNQSQIEIKDSEKVLTESKKIKTDVSLILNKYSWKKSAEILLKTINTLKL